MTTTNAANTIASSPSKTFAMNPEYLTGLLMRRESIEALLSSIEWKLLIFGAFVVVGVAGESWYGYKTWRENKTLRTVQKDIDAEQDRKSKADADETKKEIAKANDSAAKANERAAGLEKDATIAHLELEKLRQKQIARTSRIMDVKFFAAFKGKPTGTLRIWYTPDDEEAEFVSKCVVPGMVDAGWKVSDPIPIPKDLPPGPGQTMDTPLYARASGGSFNSSGIMLLFSGDPDLSNDSTPEGVLNGALREVGLLPACRTNGNRPQHDILMLIGARR